MRKVTNKSHVNRKCIQKMYRKHVCMYFSEVEMQCENASKTYIFVIHGCKNCHWFDVLYTWKWHQNVRRPWKPGYKLFNIEDILSFYGDMRKIPFYDNGANKMAAILTRGRNWRGPISKNINNDQRDECTEFHACTPKCPFFFHISLGLLEGNAFD